MTSSLGEIVGRVWRGLAKGTLDDRRDLALLRGAALVLVVVSVLLIAADPVIRGFASMSEMQRTAEATLRDRMLAAWVARELTVAAVVHLALAIAVAAPAALALQVAILHHFRIALAADGRVAASGGRVWALLLVPPVLAFLAAEAASLAALCGVWRAGAPLPAWLHGAIHWLYAAKLGLYVLSTGECLWLLFRWYYFTPVDRPDQASPGDAAVDRARLRAAIADMMWRSKYAVLVVAFYAALTLVLDQTRDALLRQILDFAADVPGAGWLQTLAGLLITLAAIALLGGASWYWPRLLLRLRSPGSPRAPLPGAEIFAKWWCRILGLAPFYVVAVMIASTFHDVPAGHEAMPWFVAALALILVTAALFHVAVTTRVPVGTDAAYYARSGDAAAARADMGWIAIAMAWGPPAVFLLARLAGIMLWTPSLALAVITAALAMWAGILGWVALESRRRAIPFLLAVAVWVGVAAFFDWTGAHRVRGLFGAAAPIDTGALRALFGAFVVLLAIGLALAAWWRRRDGGWFGRLVALGVAAVAIVAVLWIHDPPAGQNRFVDSRPTLDEAVSRWVRDLPDAAWKAPGERAPGNAYPVFIVTSEGGGIRSAYWSALVLWRLAQAIPDFDRRTFALSGVSGGALGLAIYRACAGASADAAQTRACIERFGAADLWTQLLGGMFFEDAIAAAIPTDWCRAPGCGVLGRSYWFEGALEEALPALAQGLAGAPPSGATARLFLGATRAETGERALESDVRVSEDDFPGAHDLVSRMAADLRLSTAAHNSSRFPFTNPVGALYGPGCPEESRLPEVALAAIGATAKPELCMRLQDGGYFDNSAALTAQDLLRALALRLDAFACAHDAAGAPARSACAGRIAWVKPVVIAIRNNYTYTAMPDRPRPRVCATEPVPPVDPGRALRAPPLALYPSVVTSVVTTLSTRTAHMRNFEAELERSAAAAWAALGVAAPPAPAECPPQVAAWLGTRPFHRFDLVNDGILFPSGWLLSGRAREGIAREAACSVPYADGDAAACAGNVTRKR